MDIAEKYIDFSFIESIINKNGKKKILCFGGGTAAGILMDKLLYRYPVQYFWIITMNCMERKSGGYQFAALRF